MQNLSMNLKKNLIKILIVINDDILNYNQSYLYKKKIIIFGNLPYNISTQILISWIKINNLNNFCKKFILMFQKEVADRILAEFNNKNYGRISIISSWKMEIKKIIDIDPNSFFHVLKLKVLCLFSNQKINFIKLKNPKNLEHITNIFFNQKRKMIKNLCNFFLKIMKSSKRIISRSKSKTSKSIKSYLL